MRISDWSSDVCSSDLIAEKIYKELGCKFFVSGNTGVQAGGWFNKEISSLEDFKGFKMRIPGLGGAVLKAAGTNVVNLPGGEIPPALQSGAIDATEWVGPYNDLAFGLRSEEHTSELQSLMRISYAVFCLKKNKT